MNAVECDEQARNSTNSLILATFLSKQAAQYIGEVARYLCRKDPAGPNGHYERSHRVRVMFGNGLRPRIWKEVVDRFGVDIVEFYGATEGNCTIGTLEVGGFCPVFRI